MMKIDLGFGCLVERPTIDKIVIVINHYCAVRQPCHSTSLMFNCTATLLLLLLLFHVNWTSSLVVFTSD